MTPPTATVVITTKNRKADLVTAIESALAQTAKPQVLVVDDGSTDGTAEMVRERFPGVKLDRVEKSLGLIVQRNRAAKLADGDILFSIDDDAAFSTTNTLAQTLAEFNHPRIGAVAIPFVDVNKSPRINHRAPDGPGIFCGFTYIGTSHAVRRDVFLQLGGYREFLFHQGEEMDFTSRLLESGRVVRLGRADPVHHFESPRRDFRRMDLYGRRNDVLYAWHNVPMPYFPLHLLVTSAKGIRFGLSVQRPWPMIQGLAMGYAAIGHELGQRRAISRRTYQIIRLLRKRGAVPLEEIEGRLPPLVEQPQVRD